MQPLEKFICYLCGEFDNTEQCRQEQEQHCCIHPLAKHINTIINDRIDNLPSDFKGYFMLEESYYSENGKSTILPHLFQFHLDDANRVVLTSYDIPREYPKEEFRANNSNLKLDYQKLQVSTKFNPMTYEEDQDIFIGNSVSMFTPVLKFILHEKIGQEALYVDESMEVNGKRTFGYDGPIIYKRINK